MFCFKVWGLHGNMICYIYTYVQYVICFRNFLTWSFPVFRIVITFNILPGYIRLEVNPLLFCFICRSSFIAGYTESVN